MIEVMKGVLIYRGVSTEERSALSELFVADKSISSNLLSEKRFSKIMLRYNDGMFFHVPGVFFHVPSCENRISCESEVGSVQLVVEESLQ